MGCDDVDITQLAALKAMLLAYNGAIMALLTTGISEYSLDTGQGNQRVKRIDLPKLQETYGLLYQQYDAISARCGFGGAVTVVPVGKMPWG